MLVLNGVCSVRGGVIVVVNGFRVFSCVTTYQYLVSSLQETLLIRSVFFCDVDKRKRLLGFMRWKPRRAEG